VKKGVFYLHDNQIQSKKKSFFPKII